MSETRLHAHGWSDVVIDVDVDYGADYGELVISPNALKRLLARHQANVCLLCGHEDCRPAFHDERPHYRRPG